MSIYGSPFLAFARTITPRAKSMMRQPLLSFLTSQVHSPPGGTGGHEYRGRMARPRREVMIAPREKLFVQCKVSHDSWRR